LLRFGEGIHAATTTNIPEERATILPEAVAIRRSQDLAKPSGGMH
jgi:hypothetical protein